MSKVRRIGQQHFVMPLSAVCGLMLILVPTGCTSRGSQASDANQMMEYQKFLSISQLQAYYHVEPKSSQQYPLVRGTLTNLGSESLDVVEFTVKFKDTLNKVIHEERAYPVFISSFSRIGPQTPLQSGQSTRFAFKFPACPPGWQPGQVEVEITKVIFHQSPPKVD
jgi:hypothetical protein